MTEFKWPELPWTLLGIMLGLVLVSALVIAAVKERDRLKERDEIAVTCLEQVALPDGSTGCEIFGAEKAVPLTSDGKYGLTTKGEGQ